MSEIIRLENVLKGSADGRLAVNGVNLSVNGRERVVIRGPAGSGKTSLARLIAGMDKPDAGQVFVAGQPVHGMDGTQASAFRNRTVGICLRYPALMPGLPVLENVALPLAVRGMPAARRGKAAKEQLGALGMAYAAHAMPAALSPHERTLASLARALVTDPRVLLLDEVAAGLSEREGKRLIAVLGVIGQYADAALVFFTSGEEPVPGMNRSFAMHFGTLVEGTQ